MVTDGWIADGCAMARQLADQGLRNQAADVLRYVEVRGLGLTRAQIYHRYGKRVRSELCSARGCTRTRGQTRGRRICELHMPRFDNEPRPRRRRRG